MLENILSLLFSFIGCHHVIVIDMLRPTWSNDKVVGLIEATGYYISSNIMDILIGPLQGMVKFVIDRLSLQYNAE